jgi:hypothetical protein
MKGDAKLTREVAIAVIFNPLGVDLKGERVYIPLYYAGVDDIVQVTVNEAKPVDVKVNRDVSVVLTLDMKAGSQNVIIFNRKY